MPTNILRHRADARPRGAGAAQSVAGRKARLTAGRLSIPIELLDTATAARVWAALPLYSTAETWGASIHFETPVESGRERTARTLVSPGDVCFWVEEGRVIVPFGRTPISKQGEIRLPRPCNVWARATQDVAALSSLTPGERVSLTVLA